MPYLKISSLLLILFSHCIVFSQNSGESLKSYERLRLENSWLYSENSAGHAYNPFIPDGIFFLNTEWHKGDFRLTQLPSENRIYSFSAMKTIRMNDIVFEGGLRYQNQHQKNVGWTARMNPATRNPYVLADSIFGLYKKEYVHMFGSLGHKATDQISFGIKMDYKVGDGARIKDPRPVNDQFSLDIYPSFIYSFPGIKIGANLHLLKGREKIGYTTIENSTTYRFFRFFGLGKGAKPVNSWSYTRNYYNSGIGGELQADYTLGNWALFSGFGYMQRNEMAEDGSSNPRKNDSGNYMESNYRFFTILKFRRNLIHKGRLDVNLFMGDGNEYIQEPYTEDGITYYRTIAEVSKFSLFNIHPSFNYQLTKPYNNFLNKWQLEARVEADYLLSEYLLEAEQSFSNIIPSFRYDHFIYQNKNQFGFGINGKYSLNLNQNLEQIRAYDAHQEQAAWERIILPDFLIYSSNAFEAGAHIQYGREVRFIKEKISQLFIEVGTKYQLASHESWNTNKSMQIYRLKIGITY